MLALSEQGYEVDLLTLPIGAEQAIDNINVIRVWNLLNSKQISIGPSPLKLWFDLLLIIKGLMLIRKNSYQVLHGTEEAGFICYLLSRFNKAKFIFEKHSDSYSYKAKGILKPILAAYRAVEKFTIIKSDSVISTGPALDEQAKKEARVKDESGPSFEKYFVIPDTPSSVEEPSIEEVDSIKKTLKTSENEVIVGYAGSFASYQGIDIIFDAIPKIVKENDSIKFMIVGGSEEEIDRYKNQLKQQGVTRQIEFLGKIHPDKLPAYLSASDILLAPRKSGVNSPLKILDYFKAGAAIVATNTQANQRLLNDENSVLCEFSQDAFAQSILDLSASPEKRKALGEKAYELYQSTYNFKEFSKQVETVYQRLLN